VLLCHAVLCCALSAEAKTQRDKLLEVPPRNCRYGRDIGIPVGGLGSERVAGWLAGWLAGWQCLHSGNSIPA